MNGKIGVFDSGIGGLTVLEKIKELLPNEDYVYYADSVNNPYGDKSDKELYMITSNIVDYLINKDCKIIVIACNTATTRCIDYLRIKYNNLIFIGTEPAVACDNDSKNILIMATKATVNSEKMKILINNNKKENENIYLAECVGLANAIENKNNELIEKIIFSIYDEYKDKNIDTIVLGCTHYPLVSDVINKYFKDIPLIDGANGVAEQLKRQLIKNNLLSSDGSGNVIRINSKLS